MEGRADLIGDGNAALFDDGDRGEAPEFELRKEFLEQRGGVAFYGECGKAVGDDDSQVNFVCGLLGQKREAGFIQFASEVGALEILRSICGCRVQAQDFGSNFAFDFNCQRRCV